MYEAHTFLSNEMLSLDKFYVFDKVTWLLDSWGCICGASGERKIKPS